MNKLIKSAIIIIAMIPIIVFSGDLFEVERVIDGDTFKLKNGETVRLIGIDTPETVHLNKPVERFGKEASEYAKKLLEGEIVELEYDQQRRDKYNRILAYVFLEDLFVNAELIKQGYAHAYTKYPFKQEYMDLFRQLEKEAREAEKGLWAADKTPPTPPEMLPEEIVYWLNTKSNTLHNSSCRWHGNTKEGYYTLEPEGKDCGICGGAKRQAVAPGTKTEPEDDIIVYVTKTGKKYHKAGCRYLRKSSIPIKLKDAKSRYSPCSVCKPPR